MSDLTMIASMRILSHTVGVFDFCLVSMRRVNIAITCHVFLASLKVNKDPYSSMPVIPFFFASFHAPLPSRKLGEET